MQYALHTHAQDLVPILVSFYTCQYMKKIIIIYY